MTDPFARLSERIIACQACPRLVAWREDTAARKRKAFRGETYWGKPVPGFGDPKARILAVGLAPGAHGSNRTGRMFTGDASGEFLYRHLHQQGFCTEPRSVGPQDGLQLLDLFISAVCRCVPPGNRPAPAEIARCLPFLAEELALLGQLQGIVALGRVAYQGVRDLLRMRGLGDPGAGFGHGQLLRPPGTGLWILQSYHPSRQNTQTGRLTGEMFALVWRTARRLLQDEV